MHQQEDAHTDQTLIKGDLICLKILDKESRLVPETLHLHFESEVMTAYEWPANFSRQCERGHIPPLQNRFSY